MSTMDDEIDFEDVFIDEWGLAEKIYLSVTVLEYGESWGRVCSFLKPKLEYARPDDWYTPKTCAVQFNELKKAFANPDSQEPAAFQIIRRLKQVAAEVVGNKEQRAAEMMEIQTLEKRIDELSQDDIDPLLLEQYDQESKQYSNQLEQKITQYRERMRTRNIFKRKYEQSRRNRDVEFLYSTSGSGFVTSTATKRGDKMQTVLSSNEQRSPNSIDEMDESQDADREPLSEGNKSTNSESCYEYKDGDEEQSTIVEIFGLDEFAEDNEKGDSIETDNDEEQNLLEVVEVSVIETDGSSEENEKDRDEQQHYFEEIDISAMEEIDVVDEDVKLDDSSVNDTVDAVADENMSATDSSYDSLLETSTIEISEEGTNGINVESNATVSLFKLGDGNVDNEEMQLRRAVICETSGEQNQTLNREDPMETTTISDTTSELDTNEDSANVTVDVIADENTSADYCFSSSVETSTIEISEEGTNEPNGINVESIAVDLFKLSDNDGSNGEMQSCNDGICETFTEQKQILNREDAKETTTISDTTSELNTNEDSANVTVDTTIADENTSIGYCYTSSVETSNIEISEEITSEPNEMNVESNKGCLFKLADGNVGNEEIQSCRAVICGTFEEEDQTLNRKDLMETTTISDATSELDANEDSANVTIDAIADENTSAGYCYTSSVETSTIEISEDGIIEPNEMNVESNEGSLFKLGDGNVDNEEIQSCRAVICGTSEEPEQALNREDVMETTIISDTTSKLNTNEDSANVTVDTMADENITTDYCFASSIESSPIEILDEGTSEPTGINVESNSVDLFKLSDGKVKNEGTQSFSTVICESFEEQDHTLNIEDAKGTIKISDTTSEEDSTDVTVAAVADGNMSADCYVSPVETSTIKISEGGTSESNGINVESNKVSLFKLTESDVNVGNEEVKSRSAVICENSGEQDQTKNWKETTSTVQKVNDECNTVKIKEIEFGEHKAILGFHESGASVDENESKIVVMGPSKRNVAENDRNYCEVNTTGNSSKSEVVNDGEADDTDDESYRTIKLSRSSSSGVVNTYEKRKPKSKLKHQLQSSVEVQSATRVIEQNKEAEEENILKTITNVKKRKIDMTKLNKEEKLLRFTFNHIRNHMYSHLFMKPITDSMAPGYTSKVTNPMSLSKIKELIQNGQLTTLHQLKYMIGLIGTNAKLYNGPRSAVYKMFEVFKEDCFQQLSMSQQIVQEESNPMPETDSNKRRRSSRVVEEPPAKRRKKSGKQGKLVATEDEKRLRKDSKVAGPMRSEIEELSRTYIHSSLRASTATSIDMEHVSDILVASPPQNSNVTDQTQNSDDEVIPAQSTSSPPNENIIDSPPYPQQSTTADPPHNSIHNSKAAYPQNIQVTHLPQTDITASLLQNRNTVARDSGRSLLRGGRDTNSTIRQSRNVPVRDVKKSPVPRGEQSSIQGTRKLPKRIVKKPVPRSRK